MPCVSFSSNDRSGVRYITGSCVYEEVLHDTRFIGLYWSAGGFVHRESTIPSLLELDPLMYRVEAFDLIIDGQELRNRWDWVGAAKRPTQSEGAIESVVELKHQVRPITVKVVTKLDGTPFLVRHLEITNTGSEPAALSSVSPFSSMLWGSNDADVAKNYELLPPGAPSAFSIAYLDSVMAGTEGNLVWEPLPKGVRRIEGNNGRSGYGGPYFIVRNETTGECAFGALAWSANWYAEFWNDPYRSKENTLGRCNHQLGMSRLIFRMGPSGTAPQRIIEPGETIITPQMHLSIMHSSMDKCIQSFHEHLRTSVIPPRPKGKELYTMVGNIVEHPGNWMLDEIDHAADMGTEAFIVDAGWYGSEEFTDDWGGYRGDWTEAKWFEGMLDACRERAHSHNMLIGLWMDPELVGSKSKLFAEHPDWLLKTDKDKMIVSNSGPDYKKSGCLDLSNPDAVNYLKDTILGIIKKYKLDFFKLDYNTDVFEGGQNDRAGYVESESWRHCEAMWGIFDEVRRQFPELALENCASGGGRNDLGMLSRFHYASMTDFAIFPRSIKMISNMTTFIPPESLCYYHNQQFVSHLNVDMVTNWRVTLFAQTFLTAFTDGLLESKEYCETARRYIKLAKEFANPILAAHPKVYHHTPDIGLFKPADWCVLEYAAQDASEGYAGIFRLGTGKYLNPDKEPSNEYVFKPRGLDISGQYMVTFDNLNKEIEISGSDLMSGIPIMLDQAHTSELLLFRRKI